MVSKQSPYSDGTLSGINERESPAMGMGVLLYNYM